MAIHGNVASFSSFRSRESEPKKATLIPGNKWRSGLWMPLRTRPLSEGPNEMCDAGFESMVADTSLVHPRIKGSGELRLGLVPPYLST